MSIQFDNLAQKVAADGAISAEELLSLRQLGWGDGQIHRGEADAIFAINRVLDQRDAAWTDFFVEAIGEFVLNGTEPRGMCDEEEANWLIAQIDHDGQLESHAELECLVRIVEKAHNVPETLKVYALRQVEHAVLHGTGPTRCGGELADCHITPAECALLRRLIFASGGHGPAAVSRFDAEMLFRIKDAVRGHDNAPAFKQLFVDGVANYLTGFFHANAQIDHARAKELEAFIADNSVNVGRFIGTMAREAPHVRNHLGAIFGRKERRGGGFEARMLAGEAVTKTEKDWLDAMVGADGQVDEFERALIDRIAAEG